MRARRRRDEERLDVEPEDVEREHALLSLQRAAGNAAVSRLLARQPLAEPFTAPPSEQAQPEIAPHEEGQDGDTAHVLESVGVLALGGAVEAAVQGAKSAAQQPDPAISAWAAETPATNAEYATWALAGERHGFVTLHNDSKKQLQTYAAGGAHAMAGGGGGSVSGAAGARVLPVLETVHGIAKARADRWLADPASPKSPLAIFWMARNLAGGDAHSTGAAIDAGGVAFTKPEGAAQVIQMLQDLPPGGYKIGLPYQGPFFSVFDSLMSFQSKAKKDAGEDGTPADVTTPGLVEWESILSTAAWDKAKGEWVVKRVSSASARSRIKDDALRTKLGGFDGKTFMVFPDRPNHIHIQRT